jgi:hypothetical protein
MRSNYRSGLYTRQPEAAAWRRKAGRGPWDAEPDWAAWTDDYSGYSCAAQRNSSGAWCGYVLIEDTHPINEARQRPDYDDDNLSFGGNLTSGDPVWLECHGGVTWHGPLTMPEAELSGTFVGFDCSHAGDRSPTHTWAGGTYCDLDYVVLEVTNMAEQIREYGRLQQLTDAARN